jgi:hypothetical protein
LNAFQKQFAQTVQFDPYRANRATDFAGDFLHRIFSLVSMLNQFPILGRHELQAMIQVSNPIFLI